MNGDPGLIAVGIDVGGPRKGFHAVALRDRGVSAALSSDSPAHGAGHKALPPSASTRLAIGASADVQGVVNENWPASASRSFPHRAGPLERCIRFIVGW